MTLKAPKNEYWWPFFDPSCFQNEYWKPLTGPNFEYWPFEYGQFPGRSRLNWPEADKLAWHFGLEKTGQLTGLASSKQASSKTGQFKTGQFWKQASSKQASSETGQFWNRPVQNWFSHLVPTFGDIAGPFLVQFIPWDRGNNCYVLVDKHHGKCWILLTALFSMKRRK